MPAKRQSAARPANATKRKKAKFEPHEAKYKQALLGALGKAAKATAKATTIEDVKAAVRALDTATAFASETLSNADSDIKGTVTVFACTTYMFYEEDGEMDEKEAARHFWEFCGTKADDFSKQRAPVVAYAWWYDKDANDACMKRLLKECGVGGAMISGARLKDVQSELFARIEEDVVQIPKLATVEQLKKRLKDNDGEFHPEDGNDVFRLLSE